MNALVIAVPLMVVGVVVATVPVLFGSVRHNRAIKIGRIESAESARQEADFWHRMLGRRPGRRVVPTPELLNDNEVVRVGTPSEARHSVDGESLWTTPR